MDDVSHCTPDIEDVVGGDGDLGEERVGMKLPTIEQVDGGVRVTVWRKNVVSGGVRLSHKNEPHDENTNSEAIKNKKICVLSVFCA